MSARDDRRLSTGVDALDRELSGPGGGPGRGVPAGSLLVVETNPDLAVESLAWSFARQRPTMYVTTLRTVGAVRADLQGAVPDGEYEVRRTEADTPVRSASDAVELVDGRTNVVVDRVNPLERVDRNRYLKFLTGFATRMENVGGVGILLRNRTPEGGGARGETLSVADVVWSLRAEDDGGERETTLSVRKVRRGDALSEHVKLDLGREVTVDTSRDIA